MNILREGMKEAEYDYLLTPEGNWVFYSAEPLSPGEDEEDTNED